MTKKNLLNIIQSYNSFKRVPKQFTNVAFYAREDWLRKKIDGLKQKSKVIDVGAGRCQYRPWFKDHTYKSQDFAEYAGKKSGPQKQEWGYGKLDYVSDITDIPVKANTFDIALCTEVIEHVPYPIDALREIHRILKPGGKLWLTAPLASGLHQEPYHFYGGYTKHFYQKHLTDLGFKVNEIIPSCGLLKHTAQELARSAELLNKNGKLNFIERIILGWWAPRKLGTLDSEVFIPEFTISYMVEATKNKTT